MTDIFTPEKRSYIMSRIRYRDTKIEKIMRQILIKNKIKFKSYPKMYGNPDFLAEKKIIIFCDGDFWHGHNYENKKKPGKKFWKNKIEGNIRRDRTVSRKLRSEGWSVIRFWEHDIERRKEFCTRKVLRHVNKL